MSRDVQRRIRAILPECELRFVQTGTQLLRALERVLVRGETFPVVCVRGVPFAAGLG